MMNPLLRLALLGLLLTPAVAFGQSSKKFTKAADWKSAHAMAGCWADGTTNFSDDGPGVYGWDLVVAASVVSNLRAQAAAGNPATVTFRDSGTVVTDGTGAGTEATTLSPFTPAPSVTLTGAASTTVLATVGATTNTCDGNGCTRETTFSVLLTTALLDQAGAVCGGGLTLSVEVAGDASATCGACGETGAGHADAVWRGQGLYPNIKPRLLYDGTGNGCP